MGAYRIKLNQTNLGNRFYSIQFKCRFLFFTWWSDLEYENVQKPIEYKSLKEAESKIESMVESDLKDNERVETSSKIKEFKY